MVYAPPVDGFPVYWVKPDSQVLLAVPVTAASTGTLTRATTSARCDFAQSTTVTVTTAGSVGGGSARHWPGVRSIHLAVPGGRPKGSDVVGVVAGSAVPAGVETALAMVGAGAVVAAGCEQDGVSADPISTATSVSVREA